MRSLEVQQAQLDYVATFAEPAFPLWANVQATLAGLYHAFQGLHSGLEDLTLEGDGRDLLGRTLLVTLGDQGFFRLGYDRLEAILPEYTSEELARFPSTLARADRWLRAYWARAVLQSHVFSFSIHATIQDGTAEQLLRGMTDIRFPGIDDGQATGLIFHGQLADRGWGVHLTLDHSTVAEDGLFIQYVVATTSDRTDPAETLETAVKLLHNALSGVGLRIEEAG
jgi:hypothetical protein